MTCFIIIQDEVRETENISNAPLVFFSRDNAKAEYERIAAAARADYAGKNWEEEEHEDSLEIYEDGRYGENHFRVALETTQTPDEPGDDTMTIHEARKAETVDITLSEAAFPTAYAAKMQELLEQRVFLTEAEARAWLRQCPICLELIYEKHSGLFAVESDALETGGLVSPYSRKRILTP